MALIEEETVIEGGEDVLPMPAPKKRVSGLAGRDFSELFRADRDAKRVEFTVSGKECWVELLPLDKDHRNEVARMIQKSGVENVQADPAIVDFMVGVTVVDYCLWHRPKKASGGRAEWQQIRPPQGSKAILNQIKADFHALPEFWDGLCEEVLKENGFTEDSEGNSPSPSES